MCKWEVNALQSCELCPSAYPLRSGEISKLNRMYAHPMVAQERKESAFNGRQRKEGKRSHYLSALWLTEQSEARVDWRERRDRERRRIPASPYETAATADPAVASSSP